MLLIFTFIERKATKYHKFWMNKWWSSLLATFWKWHTGAWCFKSIQDKFVKITMGHLSVIAQDSFQVTISLSNVCGHGNCLHSNVTCFQPSFQTIIDLPVKGASSDSGGRWVCIQVKYWGKVTILFQLHHLQTHQPTSIFNVEALTVEGNAPDGLLINLKKSYAKRWVILAPVGGYFELKFQLARLLPLNEISATRKCRGGARHLGNWSGYLKMSYVSRATFNKNLENAWSSYAFKESIVEHLHLKKKAEVFYSQLKNSNFSVKMDFYIEMNNQGIQALKYEQILKIILDKGVMSIPIPFSSTWNSRNMLALFCVFFSGVFVLAPNVDELICHFRN